MDVYGRFEMEIKRFYETNTNVRGANCIKPEPTK